MKIEYFAYSIQIGSTIKCATGYTALDVYADGIQEVNYRLCTSQEYVCIIGEVAANGDS